ncbi:hypothetical protein [Streptomyces cellulosae]|uniref:hypothetical protein n=1 Tax=Streptomyces cellulosae TaxID=1968 RepID=UPI000B026C6E|nr:hypothetical protein [Streptomyces cellulosae]
MKLQEAAALPLAGVTATRLLRRAPDRTGKRILLIGAQGVRRRTRRRTPARRGTHPHGPARPPGAFLTITPFSAPDPATRPEVAYTLIGVG